MLDLRWFILMLQADVEACPIPETEETHDARMKWLRRQRALRSAESRDLFIAFYEHAPEVECA